MDQWAAQAGEGATVDGATAFELYDTFGFPLDLTRLVAAEKGLTIDEAGFDKEMAAQKARSRSAAVTDTGEWQHVLEASGNSAFVGYDALESDSRILMHRTVAQKGKSAFQVVLDQTPFYAESGGQIGDTGELQLGAEAVRVVDTKKENDLIVHWLDKLPSKPEAPVRAAVNTSRRAAIARNHTATHLLHAVLQEVLGDHVQQKGSYVGPDRLRFDFSHFAKVTEEELHEIQTKVNVRIRENIPLDEKRAVPMDDAIAMGATALFGEKYGDHVRVITFDPAFSRELCGGTHVKATGQIGAFRLVSESAVAAGIRRIEAITGAAVENWVDEKLAQLAAVSEQLKSNDPLKAVEKLQAEQASLRERLEVFGKEALGRLRDALRAKAQERQGITWINAVVDAPDAEGLKQLCYDLRHEQERTAIVLGAAFGDKAQIHIMLTDDLVQEGRHAGNTVREAAKAIRGGGGGQAFYATAGGKDPAGLEDAVKAAIQILEQSV
jgi:alanyl-tRNA synthetase